MDLYGAVLAGRHRTIAESKANPLLARLADNELVLARACEKLTHAIRGGRRVTPAGEWLLDNYYLVEEQVRIAQRHLPRSYSRELPSLLNGASAGLPRVYDIALETISHGDGRVGNESLGLFIASYQTVAPLTLGELWAIPIMLRLALIENLRRVAARVMVEWNDRNLAAQWADRMTEITERDPKSVVLAVADMARSDPTMSSSFVAELTRRLQGQGPALALPLNWIEQRLAESGLSIEHLVQMEAQQQAADQVSIGNSIGSLRMLSAMDWREFVESTSVVEHILRRDPSGVYPNMDFATRDHYRHVVERLARQKALAEGDVAQAALDLSLESVSRSGQASIEAHVGWFLVDKGLPSLRQRVGSGRTSFIAWQRFFSRTPLELYLGLILLVTLLFVWPLVSALQHGGMRAWLCAIMTIPVGLAASQLAIALVNWLVTVTVMPQMLPRMDYSSGLPEHARTLVVVPSLFSNQQDVIDLIDGLEVRFLANRDRFLHFALLSDFADAQEEVLEQDASLLALARQRIEALNATYAEAESDRFFLLHRPRRWEPADKLWMGYERKRGKLAELNALLRGGSAERFLMIVGRRDLLAEMKYVITLDTDTQLPRDSAHQFVGAMDHPLNRPVIDTGRRRVVSGYGILQPRVGASLASATRSAYTRLFSSGAGIDPYTRAVSDVYQDLFHEGSFIGKGVYNVDAFESAMGGRFPDNSILSHDLLEGCYARSGLISDVELYEEYPSRYSSDVGRRHRWIRGDWQLLPWLMPRIPTQDGRREWNPLSTLSRWKIFDNLRRSLVPASLLVLFLVSWLWLPRRPWWTAAILAIILVPPILASLVDLLRKSRDMRFGQHVRVALQSSGQHFLHALVLLAWLPHEALYSLDAILRTLWRICVSRRRMLQWSVSRDTERSSAGSLAGFYRLMWIAPAWSIAVAAALFRWQPAMCPVAGPLLLLWFVSPAVAWWISKPIARAAFTPSAGESRFLRRLSRKTWAFFEAHVGPEDNWLPPDNMQEQPVAVVAHRTSPTNMGLSLLANLAAYDFGYVTLTRLLDRTEKALRTMQSMERYRGHFYNWYDTLTLNPLPPSYVSSVDSGNLAGHLLTLRAGLLALADDALFDVRLLEGLKDTVDVLRKAVLAAGGTADTLDGLRPALRAALEAPPMTMDEAHAVARQLLAESDAIAASVHAQDGSDVQFWIQALLEQCRDIEGHTRRLTHAANDRRE